MGVVCSAIEVISEFFSVFCQHFEVRAVLFLVSVREEDRRLLSTFRGGVVLYAFRHQGMSIGSRVVYGN